MDKIKVLIADEYAAYKTSSEEGTVNLKPLVAKISSKNENRFFGLFAPIKNA